MAIIRLIWDLNHRRQASFSFFLIESKTLGNEKSMKSPSYDVTGLRIVACFKSRPPKSKKRSRVSGSVKTIFFSYSLTFFCETKKYLNFMYMPFDVNQIKWCSLYVCLKNKPLK